MKNFAEVSLNGQDFGVLWKPPFRVNVTAAAKPGVNELVGQSHEPLAEPADRRRAIAAGLRVERQAAQGVAAVAARRQAQPHRPADLHDLASLDKGFAAAGVGLARPGDAANGGKDSRQMRGRGCHARRSLIVAKISAITSAFARMKQARPAMATVWQVGDLKLKDRPGTIGNPSLEAKHSIHLL